MALQDTDDGIDEAGWERAMARAPRAKRSKKKAGPVCAPLCGAAQVDPRFHPAHQESCPVVVEATEKRRMPLGGPLWFGTLVKDEMTMAFLVWLRDSGLVVTDAAGMGLAWAAWCAGQARSDADTLSAVDAIELDKAMCAGCADAVREAVR